jgi:hypothetical protein
VPENLLKTDDTGLDEPPEAKRTPGFGFCARPQPVRSSPQQIRLQARLADKVAMPTCAACLADFTADVDPALESLAEVLWEARGGVVGSRSQPVTALKSIGDEVLFMLIGTGKRRSRGIRCGTRRITSAHRQTATAHQRSRNQRSRHHSFKPASRPLMRDASTAAVRRRKPLAISALSASAPTLTTHQRAALTSTQAARSCSTSPIAG